MKKYLLPFFFVVIFFASVFLDSVFGEDTVKKTDVIKIQLHLSATAVSQAELKECLNKEFRRFKNVILVNTGADWIISVLAAKVPPGIGYKGGVIVSAVVLEPVDMRYIDMILKDVPPERVQTVKDYLSEFAAVKNESLQVGSPDIPEACRNIAESFSEKFLKPAQDKIEKKLLW